MTMLAVGTFWQVFTGVLFLLVCVLLIVVVLLQRGRGGGLSGAFGGGGAGFSPFGAKTGDFFTWLTVALAGLFLVLAIIANFAFQKVTVQAETITNPIQVPAGQPGTSAPPAQTGGAAAPAELPTPAAPAEAPDKTTERGSEPAPKQ
ncbi:MAG: preprotein translocase subunit SecG [Phycisphaerae bacterium]|nr:preprotein translocase subunit SecG [Phycisphaerae bacterium]